MPSSAQILHLVADVNLRGGHVAHQHRRQTGPDALRRQRANLFGHFLLDCRGNRRAVENSWHSFAPHEQGRLEFVDSQLSKSGHGAPNYPDLSYRLSPALRSFPRIPL